MSKSVKVNYILNLINTGTQLLLPLITFPYASRILFAEGIGKVNFFTSIITYISLFTCIGIPMYAIREIARVRDDEKKMSQTATEILLLHAGLTMVGYIIVALLCLFVPRISTEVPLFLLLSLTILFTAIGCEWFYQGIEDFAYITIRGLIVKALGIIFLFCFVKTREDIIPYAFFTVFGVLGGNLFNFFRLRKYIHKTDLVGYHLQPLRHMKPALKVFVFNVIASIYLQLNTILLGFMADNESVGYYSAAMKLIMPVMSISTALYMAMLPRLSNIVANKDLEKFRELSQKTYDFSIAISLPASIGLILISPYAMNLLSGPYFANSIPVCEIMAFTILFVAISGAMGTQILYSLGKMNLVVRCTFIGSIVDLLLCVLLIPRYSYIGAAYAYLIAEFAVTFSMYFIGKKDLPIRYFKKNISVYVLTSGLMAVVLFFVKQNIHLVDWQMLILLILIGGLLYLGVIILFKDELAMSVLDKVKTKYINKKNK